MKLVLLMMGLARADLAVCPGEGSRYEAVGLGFHRHQRFIHPFNIIARLAHHLMMTSANYQHGYFTFWLGHWTSDCTAA